MPSLAVRGLAIDPLSPSTIYAATDAGIYKSVNGAASWVSANNEGVEHLGKGPRRLLVAPAAKAQLSLH